VFILIFSGNLMMKKKVEKITTFFMKKRFKVFLYLFFIFIFCFLLFGKIPYKKKEIFEIEKRYFDWEKSGDDKLFVKLNNNLKSWPYLSSKYKIKLLQNRLNEGDEKTFRKIDQMISKKKDFPFVPFSKITLYILKKDFKKALIKSKELKKDLEDKGLTNSSIYCYTLFRNLFLEKKLKNKKEELESLFFLEKYLEKVKDSSLIEKIEKNNFSIREYISCRKRKISLN